MLGLGLGFGLGLGLGLGLRLGIGLGKCPRVHQGGGNCPGGKCPTSNLKDFRCVSRTVFELFC